MNIEVEVVGKGVLKLDMEADDRNTAIEGTLMTIENQLGIQLHINQIGQLTIDGELVKPEDIQNIWEMHQRYETNKSNQLQGQPQSQLQAPIMLPVMRH